jgi:hypothetical protein
MSVKHTKNRDRSISRLILISALVVSLLINIVQYSNKDKVSAEQVRQIAYGRFMKDCLDLATDKKTDCENTKVGMPKWYSGIDGEGWIVDSACFTSMGQVADCVNFEPSSN